MPALAGRFNQKQTYKSVAIKTAYSTIPRMQEESPFLSARPCDPFALSRKEVTQRPTPWSAVSHKVTVS